MSDAHTQRVFLIRHGETEWSKTGKHTGRTDIPLSETGKRMAALVGKALEDMSFARVLFSPLSRAAETCRIAGFSAVAEPWPDLMEWDYGRYEGLTTAQIRQQSPDWSVWTGTIPGGESVDDVATRCDRVIAEARRVNGDVALFAHGHCLRVLGARWVGLAGTGGSLLLLDTATISALAYERTQPVISLWNSAWHLRQSLA